MKFDRTRRIGEEIRRELAAALSQQLDHLHGSLLSFTAVHLTRDLSYCKVYVTHVLPDPAERQELLALLNRQAKQFRHHLARNLKLRKVPELTFVYDESIEYGAKMEAKLKDLVRDLPPEEPSE